MNSTPAPATEHAGKPTHSRYFDPLQKLWTTKILPGESHVCEAGIDEMVVTTLGSCIAACIRDPATGIGGMNHFMLPSSGNGDWAGASASMRYGNFAMEYLINEILKRGGRKETLEIGIYGGGNILDATSTDVGDQNIKFVRDYLKLEGYKIKGEDVGGPWPRKVYFHPLRVRVVVKRLSSLSNDTLQKREKEYGSKLKPEAIEGDVELF